MTASRYFSSLGRALLGKADAPISHPAQIEDELNNRGDSTPFVNGESAMRIADVYSCVRVLDDAMASFPLVLSERADEPDTWNVIDDHWLLDLFMEPRRGLSLFTWTWMLQSCLELRGKAFCRKVYSRGRVVELIPYNPNRVQVKRDRFGDLRFTVWKDDGTYQEMGEEDIWYLMGPSMNGTDGLTPISWVRDTFEASLQAQQYANNVLKNDAAVGVVVSVAGRLKPETRKVLKEDFKLRQSGAKRAGEMLLLEEGGTADRLAMTMDDLQFIESRKFNRSQIAGIFGVPLHRIMDLERATFSNIEHQGTEFVDYTMQPRAVYWAQALQKIVNITRNKRLRLSHDMSRLQRGDMKTRFEAYASAMNSGWLEGNKPRKWEGLNPIPGLDKPFPPQKPTPGPSTPGDKPGNPTPNKDPSD